MLFNHFLNFSSKKQYQGKQLEKSLKTQNPENIKKVKNDHINTVSNKKSNLLSYVKRQRIIQILK